ncbi:uncharacterized protein Z520_10949 [Fonsecaea multimorphosa CBS 102226]|uniref:O-methyltransferase C-terminal domain-containing protein n=1 Tax=Fonsecaea multimorphosa CBS 102226 TaxID=1442371 RepID=A0A0D2I7Y8_9EURO|nr:uncharacterized protein Z520_10949 [Fonsecaea multimorphosa CBS 102226]KIX93306.1 hypothetical protein Z520_10949 [Fonsecaea multimorphosa CBS 102226]OAL18543.1 hypothetical protein AYO22_10520 [Fonsecaea multimorphosa]
MAATPSLVDLATEILEAAKILQQGLDAKSLPQPSFGATGPKDYHDAAEHAEILEARARLIDASQSMCTLARGPTEALRALVSTDRTNLVVLGAIDQLKLAEAVPLDGTPIAVETLASDLQLHKAPLQRILRYAYSLHMFYEPKPGYVAHTALSAAIPAFSPYTQLMLSLPIIVGGLKVGDSLRVGSGGESSEANNKPAIPVNLAFPQHKSYWQIVQQEPDGMAKFSAAMRVVGQAIVGPKYTQYTQGFDWDGLGKAVVVDLGGGSGHIAVPIARAHQNLEIIIQDLETNAAPAKAAIPTELQDRVTFQAQDFFQPQPSGLVQSPPKAYLLSRVLHDWPDSDCVKILKNLVPVLERGGKGKGKTKLFIVDRVLPDRPGEIPLHQEALMRSLDLLMYNIVGGKERSLEEWKALFEQADQRLKISKVEIPVNSDLAMLEVELE